MSEVIILAAALFAAADIDDLAVLIALFASRAIRPRDVVIGQFVGIAALYAVSVAAALAVLAVPAAYLPWLGVLPIALGMKGLLDGEGGAAASGAGAGGILSVAAATVANGGDNLAACVPIFAGRAVVLRRVPPGKPPDGLARHRTVRAPGRSGVAHRARRSDSRAAAAVGSPPNSPRSAGG